MSLTKEQIENLKSQLKTQVQHLPEEQKKQAIEQIDSLSPEALELMLKQSQQKEKAKSQDIFRLIIEKQIPAFIVDENKHALAVLDINPISTGHTIIIPKVQAQTSMDIPNQALSLAKKISKRIISRLKAKSTEIRTEFKFNEIIINIIPIYEQKLSLSSPRTKATEEELNKIAQKLRPQKKKIKDKEIKKVQEETQSKEIMKLPKKIP